MPRHVPDRTCIVSRETKPQGDLMRFVLAPDGRVVADLRNRLPGRGAWLVPTAETVREAVRRKAFARAFKQEVRLPDDLAAEIDAALCRDVVGALGLANKAGAVVTGFAKVDSALSSGNAAALIHAVEAAEDGRRKLRQALHRAPPDTISRVAVFDDLPGCDLDMAIGRSGVIHAALLVGEGSVGCLVRWRRLRLFRGVDDRAAPPRDKFERPDGPQDQTGRNETV